MAEVARATLLVFRERSAQCEKIRDMMIWCVGQESFKKGKAKYRETLLSFMKPFSARYSRRLACLLLAIGVQNTSGSAVRTLVSDRPLPSILILNRTLSSV